MVKTLRMIGTPLNPWLLTMTRNRKSPAAAAEHYETQDVSGEMEAGTWGQHETRPPVEAMSGFNSRLPTAVRNDARAIVRARG
jgi:hypothetical protein